jgi:hypothetical protein
LSKFVIHHCFSYCIDKDERSQQQILLVFSLTKRPQFFSQKTNQPINPTTHNFEIEKDFILLYQLSFQKQAQNVDHGQATKASGGDALVASTQQSRHLRAAGVQP